MTVIFGKAHDLTDTDVGYKFIDLYSNVAHGEITFCLESVSINKTNDDRVQITVDDAKRTEIEEFEGDVLINIEKLFEGKITGVSLAKLYCSSIHDDKIVANAEDGFENMYVDVDQKYDVLLTCEQVYISQGNSSFGAPLKIKAIGPCQVDASCVGLKKSDPIAKPLDGSD
jgi:hypothetical protein